MISNVSGQITARPKQIFHRSPGSTFKILLGLTFQVQRPFGKNVESLTHNNSRRQRITNDLHHPGLRTKTNFFHIQPFLFIIGSISAVCKKSTLKVGVIGNPLMGTS